MLSLDDFLEQSGGKAQVFRNLRTAAEGLLTEKLTVCIPDVHLLERGPTDDFSFGYPEQEEKFLSLLDFLLELKKAESDGLEIIQVGDLYDLWQARGNTNLIWEAYTNILGLLDKLGTVYVVGNHDIDLVQWYKDKGETFGRKWRHFSTVDGQPRVIYEHGFQADFANNQESWSGIIGRQITIIVGMAEYLHPDIDVELGKIWDAVSRMFSVYNAGLTPVKNPEGFDTHEYLGFYLELLEKYNRGDTDDHQDPANLALAVVGHTHTARLVKKPRNGRTYYMLDCGSWVNGGHEIGVISGKELAVCQWA